MPQSPQLTIEQAISRAKKAAKQGNTTVALQLYGAVLQHQPNHPVAKKGLRKLQGCLSRNQATHARTTIHSQAQINALVNLYYTGQMAKTVQACREFLQIHPQSFPVINLLGMALQRQGKLQKAVQAFEQAIEIKPDLAEAYGNRGNALKDLGQLQEAVKSYEQAIELKPELAEAYSNRGNALYELGKLQEAVDSYEKAIELKPDYAEAYFNRGTAFKGLGRLQESVKSYEKAIEYKPDSAEAYNNRGNALKDLGKLQEAVDSYEKAIEFKPDYAEAHRNLSALKIYKRDNAQIGLMERLFTESEPSDSDRMHLCFALAKVYEDLGEYDKSFKYLSDGNMLRQKELNYNIGNDRRMIAKIREIFTAGPLTPAAVPDGDASIQPVFIVGMPRSGTSLVEQVLASHTKVHGAGELDTMSRLVIPVLNNCQDERKLSGNEIGTIHDGYLDALAALNVSEKIITDKMPLNFQWIGFILSAFPSARIINLNRDPRATCWSIYKHFFSSKGNGYAYDIGNLVAFHKLYIELMTFWRERFPNSIYDIYYEDLTENQEQETHKLLEFCNLEWENQCLDFHEMKRAVKTASAAQVREKMYKGSSGAWRKYEEHLRPLINGLGY